MASISDSGTRFEAEQQAKEFIWSHLEQPTKDFIIHISKLTKEERSKLYINKILCHLSAEKNNDIIGKEVAILSLQ